MDNLPTALARFAPAHTPGVLIYAGIDEAGYGPMLGPLTVGCCAFEIADHNPADGAPNLWRLLDNAVCRKKADKKHRIAIDDSKNLKGSKTGKAHPLTHLERGVLSFISELHETPATDDALFRGLGLSIADVPWYRSASATALPLGQSADELAITRARLSRAMHKAGVRLRLMRAEAVDAGPFNEQVAQTRSKATVNFAAAMRMVDLIWNEASLDDQASGGGGDSGGGGPRIIIDRHGGRMHYREELQTAFPGAFITIIAEEPTISRYRLERNGSQATITFAVDADQHHFPVALASMTAKYTRELFMARLNEWFRGHLPELKPTAGYVQDGRRFLAEIEPLIETLAIPRQRLVRAV